jgi:capsular exopolysaccharide synthesis family protein
MEVPAFTPERPVLADGPAQPEQSIVTLADIRKILMKRKWLILAGVVVGVAFAALYILTTVPQFQATSLIDINIDRQSNIGISDILQQASGGAEGDQVQIQTEIAIMQSDSVSMAVIDSLDLYKKAPFSNIFAQAPYNGHLTPGQRIALLGTFKGSTKILPEASTDLVKVSFQNQNPAVAAEVANAIVDRYMDRSVRVRFEGVTRISDWLSGQLDKLKQQATNSQEQLAAYAEAHNMIGGDSDGGGDNLALTNLASANQELSEAEADRVVKEARYRMAMTGNPELLVSVAPSATLAQLQQQEAALVVQQAQLQSKFGPDWPRVKEVNDALAALRKDIHGQVNALQQRFAAEYQTAVSTQNLMQQRLDQAKQEAFRQNRSAAEYQILRHGAESASDLYDALQTRLKEAGITAGLNANQIDIVDRATVPARPISPVKSTDAAVGLGAGILLGLVLAVFAETIDDTIRTSDDAEAIAGLPALAVIPHFDPALKKGSAAPGTAAFEAEQERMARVSPDVISYTEPQSYVAEGFRTLRSSILLSAVDRQPKLLLLTSCFATEGKSTCASNLAISFARRSARVLLVDTDLRKGTLHMKFRTSNRFGLSTLLVRENEGSAYETPLPDLPNLTLVTRGPISVNPGEALASRSMEALLEKWRQEYDHVILDSSPVLAVADTLSIAPLADATFILVRSGVTRKKALVRVREQLRRVHARVQGVIVNDVDLRLENYYTYSKRYNYSYNSTYGAGYGGGMDAEQ